jgi:hypothetical protein
LLKKYNKSEYLLAVGMPNRRVQSDWCAVSDEDVFFFAWSDQFVGSLPEENRRYPLRTQNAYGNEPGMESPGGRYWRECLDLVLSGERRARLAVVEPVSRDQRRIKYFKALYYPGRVEHENDDIWFYVDAPVRI